MQKELKSVRRTPSLTEVNALCLTSFQPALPFSISFFRTITSYAFSAAAAASSLEKPSSTAPSRPIGPCSAVGHETWKRFGPTTCEG